MSKVAATSARVGAGADLVGGRARAAEQRQRVDHDGLARAGFAGEHGEAAD